MRTALAAFDQTRPEMFSELRCVGCGASEIVPGICVEGVPAHAVRLHPTQASALAEQHGMLRLVGCARCGLVYNASFDIDLMHYDGLYEGTQAYSPTFTAFNRTLAQSILQEIEAEGSIVEIGCGQGELLALFLELGQRSVVGFDPAYSPTYAAVASSHRAEIHATEFDPRLLNERPAAIVSKMTLEHIAEPTAFLRDVAATIPDCGGTTVFIQVPNAEHVFESCSIGDLLYEHCNYFTAASLAATIRQAGLRVLSTEVAYGGQYLHAVAEKQLGTMAVPTEPDQGKLSAFLTFSDVANRHARNWRRWLHTAHANGRRLAFWGGASKAVGFLSVTGVGDLFETAIDINPRKQGTFLPSSGIEIVGPKAAAHLNLTDILVCNPIYMAEVAEICERVGISAALHPMTDPPGGPSASA